MPTQLISKIFITISALLGLSGCGSSTPSVTSCESTDSLEVVCGFQNPEDLALLPNSDALLVSQFGSMDGSRPGNLALYTLNGDLEVIFRGGGPTEVSAGWGDPVCPGGPSSRFSPHGIDLDRRPDGILQLLVVNHGGREAIEFFEVHNASNKTTLKWRGCVTMAHDLYLNDVVSQKNGGFWATHMMTRSSDLQMLTSLFGKANGYVVSWSPGGEVTKVPGTDGAFPNGIEKSADEAYLYINMYTRSGVVKYEFASAEVVDSIDLPSPDNSYWDRDGVHLLVASHSASVRDQLACLDLKEGSCGFQFEIVSVDTRDMTAKTILSQSGPPMGAATVAVPVGERLVLGTYAGDRIGIYQR